MIETSNRRIHPSGGPGPRRVMRSVGAHVNRKRAEKEESMKALYLVTLCTIAVGCVTSREAFLPDGGKGHSINCSGTGLNWGSCYEKAGEICGTRGYDVIAGGSDQGMVVAGSQYGLYGGSVMSRSMLIKCRN